MTDPAEIIAAYRARRARQWVIAGLALLALGLTALPPCGSVAGLGMMIALLAVTFRSWRCPACDGYLGRSVWHKRCPRCGVSYVEDNPSLPEDSA